MYISYTTVLQHSRASRHETNLAAQHPVRGSNALSCAQHSGLYQCQVHFLPGTWRFLCGFCTQKIEGHKHYHFNEKNSHSNERDNKVNKLHDYKLRVHICLFKITPSTVTSHTENLCPANGTTWVTPSLIQRPLNRMWTWMLVSVALINPLQLMKSFNIPFLASLHSEQQQPFNMESGWKEQTYQGGRGLKEYMLGERIWRREVEF